MAKHDSFCLHLRKAVSESRRFVFGKLHIYHRQGNKHPQYSSPRRKGSTGRYVTAAESIERKLLRSGLELADILVLEAYLEAFRKVIVSTKAMGSRMEGH